MPTKKKRLYQGENLKTVSDPTTPQLRQNRALETSQKSGLRGNALSLRIEMLVDAFLSGRSERTIRAYRQDLFDFRGFTQEQTLLAAVGRLLLSGHGEANALVSAYKSALMARGLSASTINRRLAALRSVVKLARTFGIVRWTLEIDNVKAEPYRDTQGPGRNGVQRMMDVLDGRKDNLVARDRAIIRLLYDLALRRGEVVSLNLSDLDLEAATLCVTGKGRMQKTILSLPQPTKAALSAWVLERGNVPGPLFSHFDRAKKGDGRLSGTSLYRIVRKLGEAVGVKVTPHGLRHTAITEACKMAALKGIDLEEVLDFSRHTDIKVLMVYRDRERDVQGVLANLVAEEI